MARSPASPASSASAASAAGAIVIALLAAVIIYCIARPMFRKHRDGFSAHRAQEVYQSSRDLFDRTRGAATYSEYKLALDEADPVLYTDVRRLWKEGRLSPDEVAKVI